MNGFIGTNIKSLDHFITPNLVEDEPDIVIIHTGSNYITHNTVDQINVMDIVNRIINIGKKCLSYSVKEVIISSIFIKKQFKLTRIIRQVNDFLRDESKINNFQFISNDDITKLCQFGVNSEVYHCKHHALDFNLLSLSIFYTS